MEFPPQDYIWGIHSLRERLCEVLFQQIKRELPGLITEILMANDEAKARLDRIGRSRATLMEKRMFVMELGQKFHEICFAACEGLYENPFFGEPAFETAPRRLRAVVQNASIDFAKKLLQLPLRVITKSTSEAEATPIVLRAKTLIQTHRGKELPGTFNPLLIGQLFRELSSHWAHYTRKHTNNMWLCTRLAVVAMLETLMEKQVMDVCIKKVVDPELDKMQRALDKRLDDYMLEFYRHPITYNYYLTDTVQALKEERFRGEVASRCHQLFDNRGQLTCRDIELIVDTVVQTKERNMDDLAAQDLVDYTEAYYKVALKRIVDEVPVHVAEPSILTGLPKLFDSTKILDMPSNLIEAIGGELLETTKFRECLQSKMDVLSRSSLICRVYMDKAGETDQNSGTRTPEESLVRVDSRPAPAASRTLSVHQEKKHHDLRDNTWLGPTGPSTDEVAVAEDELSFFGTSSRNAVRLPGGGPMRNRVQRFTGKH